MCIVFTWSADAEIIVRCSLGIIFYMSSCRLFFSLPLPSPWVQLLDQFLTHPSILIPNLFHLEIVSGLISLREWERRLENGKIQLLECNCSAVIESQQANLKWKRRRKCVQQYRNDTKLGENGNNGKNKEESRNKRGMRQNLHQITEGEKLAVMLMSGSSQPERLCLHIIKSVCVCLHLSSMGFFFFFLYLMYIPSMLLFS